MKTVVLGQRRLTGKSVGFINLDFAVLLLLFFWIRRLQCLLLSYDYMLSFSYRLTRTTSVILWFPISFPGQICPSHCHTSISSMQQNIYLKSSRVFLRKRRRRWYIFTGILHVVIFCNFSRFYYTKTATVSTRRSSSFLKSSLQKNCLMIISRRVKDLEWEQVEEDWNWSIFFSRIHFFFKIIIS